MRLSPNHIDYMAVLVLRALRESSHVELKNADAVIATVRSILTENLRQEAELEREAEALLAKHRAEILRQGGDYRKMLQEGKKTLAKKKGIVL